MKRSRATPARRYPRTIRKTNQIPRVAHTPSGSRATHVTPAQGAYRSSRRSALDRFSLWSRIVSDLDFQQWRELCAPDVLGEAPPILRCLEMIRRVAPSDSSVLLTGETGTGKELFAGGSPPGPARHRRAPGAGGGDDGRGRPVARSADRARGAGAADDPRGAGPGPGQPDRGRGAARPQPHHPGRSCASTADRRRGLAPDNPVSVPGRSLDRARSGCCAPPPRRRSESSPGAGTPHRRALLRGPRPATRGSGSSRCRAAAGAGGSSCDRCRRSATRPRCCPWPARAPARG